ncbi:MAG: MFS transporter [Xanthomonadales bacterium]|nr:MFS transporter [Xanthomonadales bacterium]MCP5475617.1 MFS transporter [Rhodanobacteraceae bacterium]
MKSKPQLTFWQIWNMCFGFLGIQFAFALQNGNVSRIFQTLGAQIDEIPILWIAAPLTGLLVQPLVGYYSDRTWNRLGRRRPYFLAGAILTTCALMVMPNSPALWVAALMLWLLDASINISMEPFRAFVGDNLPKQQRATGYSMQSFFIGVGAVVAGLMPWALQKLGVANTAAAGEIPDNVRYSFYAGGMVLLLAMGWTILRSREYPPEELRAFDDAEVAPAHAELAPIQARQDGWIWLAIGIAGFWAVTHYDLRNDLYVAAGMVTAYGLALLIQGLVPRDFVFAHVMADLHAMPDAMRKLALVQFFSWFALFSMWIYTTSAVTSVHFGSSDPTSAAYNNGADWVNVLFGAYNGFAAVAAIGIPFLVRKVGLRMAHLINLWIGAGALLSFLIIRDPNWLLLSMVGIGIAWASILALPYAMLSDSLPAEKMGVYMGIFNFFIVIPQLLAASVLGVILKTVFANQPIYALVIGGVSFLIAGLCVLRVREPSAERVVAHA